MDKKSKSERYSGPVLTFSRLLKPVHIVIIIALVLSISGTMDRTKTDQNSIDTGANLVKISVVLFLIVWGILCMASLCFYAVRSRFSPMQRIVSACRRRFDGGGKITDEFPLSADRYCPFGFTISTRQSYLLWPQCHQLRYQHIDRSYPEIQPCHRKLVSVPHPWFAPGGHRCCTLLGCRCITFYKISKGREIRKLL